jgi:hypothetical protein
MRQHSPRAAAAGQIEQSIEDVAQLIGTGSSALATFGFVEQVFDVMPLEIRQVAGVSLPCVHGPQR